MTKKNDSSNKKNSSIEKFAKFIFENTDNCDLEHECGNAPGLNITQRTNEIKNLTDNWLQAINKKIMCKNIKEFLYEHPYIDSISFGGSWEYEDTAWEGKKKYSYYFRETINIILKESISIPNAGFAHPIEYLTDLASDHVFLSEFSDYQTQLLVENMNLLTISNIDFLFEKIASPEELEVYMATQQYEKLLIEDMVNNSKPKSSKVTSVISNMKNHKI